MRVLIDLIQAGKTVVYQSAELERTWIFRKNGECSLFRKIHYEIPELDDPETFHIFDAKAGFGSEPATTEAKLLLFSSTNQRSYKQVARRKGIKKLLFPSASKEEFERCGRIFCVSDSTIAEIIDKFGHGKIRNVNNDFQELMVSTNTAISNFDFSKMRMYASADNVVDGIAESSPSILLDGFVKPDESDLITRYSFWNANWDFSSDYITNKLVEKCLKQSNEFVWQIVSDTGKSEKDFIGALVGKLLEHLAAKR
jgi:hypothetical protein